MTTHHTTSAGPARAAAAVPHAWAALALGATLLAGCATGPQANPADPFEGYNRGMTRFNDQVDEVLLKPVATVYKEITPQPVRTGVTNVFANLGDAWSFVNNLLQLRMDGALDSLVRFNVNTVFGIGGLFDVASEMGIERHKQDFGLTLGRWGVPTGPYLVLPVLGPSTVRDTVALPVDWQGDLVTQIDHVPTRNSLYALHAVDRRANLLGAGSVIESAALDKYSFTRDVFLQLRNPQNGQAGSLNDRADESGDGKLPPEPN